MTTERHGSGNGGPTIVWFRNDLRLDDNPALHAAIQRKRPVLAIFVLETDNGLRALGAASRWWLHHSLERLGEALEKAGANLHFYEGAAGSIVPELVRTSGAGALLFNRRYGESGRKLDDTIGKAIEETGCAVESFNGRLLNEPWEIETQSGGPYGVYTPYWKNLKAKGLPEDTLPKPGKVDGVGPPSSPKRSTLDGLGLLPSKPNWAEGWDDTWTPGEAGAAVRLREFLKHGLGDYHEERNRLASRGTSHLSPHLRFGEVSPRQIVAAVRKATTKANADNADSFLSEVAWRDFDYHNLFYHPDVAEMNLHDKYDAMPWRTPKKAELDAWKKGQTGFPVVDAGMRELWQTGYMHNRVRMITASFLIKDMLCDWRVGEKWFWDCLCDADPANNTMNWQWVAGSGADASPFFRVFNPTTQGERYDPEGDYIRRWVPELGKLGKKAIHAPWEADATELKEAGVELGKTYPRPMLDHKEARDRALAAYNEIK